MREFGSCSALHPIMKPALSRFLSAAALAAAGLTVPVQGQSLPAPGIAAAREFRFTPQPGTAWMVQGSVDGDAWQDVAGPFFGQGETVRHLQPAGDTARQFRLRYVDPAATGHAPVMAGGFSLLMEHQGRAQEVIFMNAARGILRIDDAHARSFTYTWTKTAPDRVEAVLSGLDGTFTLLRLEFAAGAVGRWGMEDIASPQAARTITQPLDSGIFTWREGRFRRGEEEFALPLLLDGRSLLLNESGSLTRLHFTSATTVNVVTASGSAQQGTYAYEPNSLVEGRLHLNIGNLAPQAFDLEARAPGIGRFNEDGITVGGTPRTGTFTFPDDQDAPVNPNCPPLSLAGQSYVINDSSPCTLSFNADGTGTQMKEVNGVMEVTHFAYSYSRTGRNSASVAITFTGIGGDLIDDYSMDFDEDCAGAFSRDSYADGSSAGSENGTFGPGGLAGRFFGGTPPGLGL